MKQRLEYIDCIKGTNMILVVYWHIYGLCCGMYGVRSATDAITLFNMPLFFFMSGLMAYRDMSYWTLSHSLEFIGRKAFQLLLPTICVGGIYMWWFDKDISQIVDDIWKGGYWFTIFLFVFFLIYTLFQLLYNLVLRNNVKICKMGGVNVCALLCCAAVINKVAALYWGGSFGEWGDKLSILHYKYFMFFILGVIARRYWSQFHGLLSREWSMAFMLPLFIACFVYKGANRYIEPLSGVLGILLVYVFFYYYQDMFNRNRIGNMLQLIGRNTLGIYLLHYFFLPYNLKALGRWLTQNNNPSLEFPLLIAIAMVVITLCLGFIAMIKMSAVLRLVILGERKR